MPGQQGECGFCGTRVEDVAPVTLPSAVRSGTPESGFHYAPHPNALPDSQGRPGQRINWCGSCVRGLTHKFQRLSDANLHAKLIAYRLWRELDGVHWSLWDDQDALGPVGKAALDDPAVHGQKLTRDQEIDDMEAEVARRAGADLTDLEDWIP